LEDRLGKWVPLCVFTLVPVSLFAIAYTYRGQGPFLGVMLLMVLLVFGCYILFLRREGWGSAGSILPTILGPLLAGLALQGADSPLVGVWETEGGSFLVELSFFFAGVIGLFTFVVTQMIAVNRTERERKTGVAGLVCLVLALLLIGLNAKAFYTPPDAPGPEFLMGFHYPGDSLLLLGRIILVLFSVVLAAWPRE
jgi:hypothetical protein